MDALTLGGQVVAFYFLTRAKEPITVIFVIQVAIVVSCSLLCIASIFFRRLILFGLISRIMDNFEHLMESVHTGVRTENRHLGITEMHTMALRLLASDPNLSIKTAQALHAVLIDRQADGGNDDLATGA
jgi:hypothetical protein